MLEKILLMRQGLFIMIKKVKGYMAQHQKRNKELKEEGINIQSIPDN